MIKFDMKLIFLNGLFEWFVNRLKTVFVLLNFITYHDLYMLKKIRLVIY